MKNGSFYKNKVVIITGGSSGIGKEIAKQILMCEGSVLITGRNANKLQETYNELQQISPNIMTFQGDISSYERNQQLVFECVKRFGKIDILINNAGISAFGKFDQYQKHVIDETIGTNLLGVLFLTNLSIEELKKSKGSIFIISSLAAFYGLPNYSLYSTTKIALKAFVQSLQIELKSSGVFVGISFLGFIENELNKKALSSNGELIIVPKRNRFLTRTKEKAVNGILKQIEAKKGTGIQSVFGKIIFVFSFLTPGIIRSGLSLQKYKT